MTSALRPNSESPLGTQALQRILTETGSVQRVQELEKHGIQQVRLMSASRMQDLVRVAVNRVLRSSLDDIEIDDRTRDELLRRATEEFEVLVREGIVPEPSPEPAPGPEGVGLREVLDKEERTMRGLVQGQPQDGEVSLNISPLSDEFRAFEERMVGSISELLDKDWRTELTKVQDSQRHQLELLEQRISKLVRALESTDRVLAHVQRGRTTAGEDGVEYTPEDVSPLTEKKSQLLQALFQANLQLRSLHDDDTSEAGDR